MKPLFFSLCLALCLSYSLPNHFYISHKLLSLNLLNGRTFDRNECFLLCCPGQVDLETIKDMYLEKYDVTLKDALDSECGGDFKRLLMEILH